MSEETQDLMAARDAAWRRWIDADHAWSMALHRAYPRDAGTRRYTADGVATSELRRLHDNFQSAKAAYYVAQDAYTAARMGREAAA